MRKRLSLSVAALVIGASLLVAAGLASPASSKPASPSSSMVKKGGTLHINMSSTDVDFVDPALAYFQPAIELEYAVCRELVNYPPANPPRGGILKPDAAVAMPRVAANGSRYTFTIRKGIRFNDGSKLTAKNFAYVLNRNLDASMNSPDVPFIGEIKGTNSDGVLPNGVKAASGIKASGYKLVISIKKPDPAFISKLGFTFNCALKVGTPHVSQGINQFASAGPYYFASRTPGRSIVLKRNKYYKGILGHNPTQIVVTANTNPGQSLLQVEKGQVNTDIGGLPPEEHARLGRQYGVNKRQYFVKPQIETDYLALNTTRPCFRSAAVRKAVSYGLNRRGMLAQRGAYGGVLTDQILPPGIPGYHDWKIYPLTRPNLSKAKKLMGGKHLNCVHYTSTSPTGQALAQFSQQNLKLLGIDTQISSFKSAVMYRKAGTRGEPFDILTGGWGIDFNDPVDFVDILMNGDNIHDTNNNNYSYFNNSKYNKRMRSAARLFGSKRYSAYGKLDKDIMTSDAPIAAYDNRSDRFFVSKHTGCVVQMPVYTGPNIGALCRR
jgi:peptide/nickel transport system substrate-binding protein